jgi:hypothetical protein
MYHYLCAIADGESITDFCAAENVSAEVVSGESRSCVGYVEIDMSLYERDMSKPVNQTPPTTSYMQQRKGYIGGRAVVTRTSTAADKTAASSGDSSLSVSGDTKDEWVSSWSESKIWIPTLFLLMWDQVL